MPNTKPAVPTDETATRHQLYDQNPARWHRQGYWTLEDLDVPPPGSISKAYRNLLRDQPKAEQVEAGPSPRDLAPTTTPTHKFDF